MRRKLSSLQERGYSLIEYPDRIRQVVAATASAWDGFHSLPLNLEKLFPFVDTKVDASGHEEKPEKSNFHLKLADGDELTRIARSSGNAQVNEFIARGQQLLHEIQPMVEQFAMELDHELGPLGTVLRREVLSSQKHWVLRCLNYRAGQEEGYPFAKAHTDRCGLTVYLYQSQRGGGVDYLDWNKQWHRMSIPEGQTCITGNLELQLLSEGLYTGLCHRVLADEVTAREGRQSVVVFIPFLETPVFNPALGGQAHFIPGWNYKEPFDLFKQRFVARN